MMKLLVVTMVFITVVEGSVIAQKKTTAKENSIRSITEYKQDIEKKGPQLKEAYTLYDKSGNILEEIEYNSEGLVKTHFKYQYDLNNNKVKEIEISPSGKTIRVTEYKYNSNNLRIERNTYDGAGKLKAKRTYQYEFQE